VEVGRLVGKVLVAVLVEAADMGRILSMRERM
jgi:hypothetical protein